MSCGFLRCLYATLCLLERNFEIEQAPPYDTPPVISGMASTVASTSVTFSWTTEKPATSHLLFRSSTAMAENIPPDTTFVTSHSLRVSGLVPSTTYYHEVQSIDESS